MQSESGPNKAVVGIVIVALLAVGAGGIYYLQQQNDTSQTAEVHSTQDDQSKQNESSASVNSYKDGTYSATGTYQSPGGTEEIAVTVTINDGVIKRTSATPKAASGTSRQYQREFVSNYEAKVVGKNIDDVKLDRVAGSSLTSNGFNEALDEIKQDARM